MQARGIVPPLDEGHSNHRRRNSIRPYRRKRVGSPRVINQVTSWPTARKVSWALLPGGRQQSQVPAEQSSNRGPAPEHATPRGFVTRSRSAMVGHGRNPKGGRPLLLRTCLVPYDSHYNPDTYVPDGIPRYNFTHPQVEQLRSTGVPAYARRLRKSAPGSDLSCPLELGFTLVRGIQHRWMAWYSLTVRMRFLAVTRRTA